MTSEITHSHNQLQVASSSRAQASGQEGDVAIESLTEKGRGFKHSSIHLG